MKILRELKSLQLKPPVTNSKIIVARTDQRFYHCTLRVTSNAFHANAGTQNAAQKEYIETWRDSRSNVPNRERRKKRRTDAKTDTTACEKKLRKIEYDFPGARITISHEA